MPCFQPFSTACRVGKCLQFVVEAGGGFAYNNTIQIYLQGGITMHKKHPRPPQRIERKISAAASISMCVLTVLAQIATTFLLTLFLKEYSSYAYAVLELIGAIVAIRVYQRPGSPSYKLVWMCVLLALPVTGMLLFLLWGGGRQAKSLSLRKIPPIPQRESWKMASEANLSRLRRQIPNWGRLATFLQKKGFLLYRNTKAKYFGDGAEYFEDLIQHLKKAENYIFLEYFIVAEGRIWDRVVEVLKERAAAGVEVCLIFDDFGALTRFSDTTFQSIQKDGIAVEVFNPVQTSAANMSAASLKERFGKDVVFWGGAYDAQLINPNATYDEVWQTVYDNIKVLGKDGNYIFAGVHNLPATMPESHLKALIDAYRAARDY
jgi:hypothetical protein